jgi:hypothetical protein
MSSKTDNREANGSDNMSDNSNEASFDYQGVMSENPKF